MQITGYSHGANTEVIRTMLLGKVEGLKFLEVTISLSANRFNNTHTILQFSVQDSKIMATVGSKAEANALQNISGVIFANKKV